MATKDKAEEPQAPATPATPTAPMTASANDAYADLVARVSELLGGRERAERRLNVTFIDFG